jgi:T-complex protein 1 subunit delta
MDKMIQAGNGETEITNDGATIMSKLEVTHPAARMMVDLSKSQDVEAGDGTTTVVVLAGSLLHASEALLAKGIHPTVIAESFLLAATKAEEVIESMAIKVDLKNRDELVKIATTSLSSKVVSAFSDKLAGLAVDAVLHVLEDVEKDVNVDLEDIKLVKKLGGTVSDTELIDGMALNQKALNAAGGPTAIKDAKIGLIQYQLSPPKPYMDSKVVIADYTQMDRAIREEKKYIAGVLKQIKAAKCNVLLVQKSILRDAVTDLSLHFLAKAKVSAGGKMFFIFFLVFKKNVINRLWWLKTWKEPILSLFVRVWAVVPWRIPTPFQPSIWDMPMWWKPWRWEMKS